MPLTLLWAHALGDLIIASKYWSPDYTKELTRITWRQRYGLGPDLLRGCPLTKHIEHDTAPHQPVSGDWIKDLAGLPYYGSPFTRVKPDASRPYLVIQPSTVLNPQPIRHIRDFRPDDWDRTIAELERRQLIGIVLNSPGAAPAPVHHLVADLQGKTSATSSLNRLLGSLGYIGIDSWLSVIATEVCSTVLIRSVNPWVHVHKDTIYSPMHLDLSDGWMMAEIAKIPPKPP